MGPDQNDPLVKYPKMTIIKRIIKSYEVYKDRPAEAHDVPSLHKGTLEVQTKRGTTSGSNFYKTQLIKHYSTFNMRLVVLPDVSEFTITLGEYNKHLLSIGLVTRLGSTKTIVRHKNRQINRYLYYSYHRLLKATQCNNDKLY